MVLLERLELRTRPVKDFGVAVTFRDALLEAKLRFMEGLRELRGAKGGASAGDQGAAWPEGEKLVPQQPPWQGQLSAEELGDMLSAAVGAALKRRRLEPNRDMGLYLRVNMPAKQWIGSALCGPVFHLGGASMALGMRSWKLLCEARGSEPALATAEGACAAWRQVRSAHLTAWSLTGRDCAHLARRLDELEQRRRTQAAAGRLRRAARARDRGARLTAVEAARAARAAARSLRAAGRAEAAIGRLLDTWAKRLRAVAGRARCGAGKRCRAPVAGPRARPQARGRAGCRQPGARRVESAASDQRARARAI
ncbi:unnamed protein product [Prorocentrum cordatum]|nr:unnamed protein product [Polarella glacialis]